MTGRHSTKDLFYSYPDWLIAQVCVVHIQTARHWKSGIRKPGPTALRLWSLYTDGRILTDEWRRWGVRKGALCTPEGQEITQGQLSAWPFVWDMAQAYARLNRRAAEQLAHLVDYDSTRKKQKAPQTDSRGDAAAGCAPLSHQRSLRKVAS